MSLEQTKSLLSIIPFFAWGVPYLDLWLSLLWYSPLKLDLTRLVDYFLIYRVIISAIYIYIYIYTYIYIYIYINIYYIYNISDHKWSYIYIYILCSLLSFLGTLWFIGTSNVLMMICGWTILMSQHPLENDHKQQQICQIRHKNCLVVRPVFQVCLFYAS